MLKLLLSTIVQVQIAYWIYAKWPIRIVNALIHFGVISFGVYLFHPLVLYFYRMTPVSGNPILYHAWVVGGFLSALFISWLVVGLTMKYFKGAWMIFGSQPKVMPYKKKEETQKQKQQAV